MNAAHQLIEIVFIDVINLVDVAPQQTIQQIPHNIYGSLWPLLQCIDYVGMLIACIQFIYYWQYEKKAIKNICQLALNKWNATII